MRCHIHDLELYNPDELLEHLLNNHILTLEQLMTEMSDDKKHLDADVAALTQAFKDEMAALRAQIQANPTQMVSHLDLSGLDALVGTEQKQVANDTPALIPSDHPSLAATNAPVQPVIAGTQASPFVDADADEVDGKDTDGDADDTPSSGPAPDTTPAGEAAQAPGQTADTVVAPEAEVTPSTENPPTA